MEAETILMTIKLDGIKSVIWRRFVVDSSISLHKLHEIIQVVMGWTNSHLYEFTIHRIQYGIPSDEDDFLDYEIEDARKKKLKSLKLNKKDKIKYTYDFGDDWRHTIIIGEINNADDTMSIPSCLDGERNCPPEDCGSIPGYEDIVNAMKEPKSKAAKEFIEWLGEPYDDEYFDLAKINEVLKSYKTKLVKNGRE